MLINFISNIRYKIKIQYNTIKIRLYQSQFKTQIMTPAAGGVADQDKIISKLLKRNYKLIERNHDTIMEKK